MSEAENAPQTSPGSHVRTINPKPERPKTVRFKNGGAIPQNGNLANNAESREVKSK